MMKTTLGTVEMLLFLVIVLSANLLLVAPEAVLDLNGEEVKAGDRYFIISAIRGAGGGGVTLGTNRNGTLCPRDVVQEQIDLNRGIPVTFYPVNNPKNGVVQLQTDLNIDFSAPNFCRQSTVWKLQDSFVTTGGVIGNPGLDTLSNWFSIEKISNEPSRNVYKLVFCPTVCDFCRPICGDIGLFIDNNGVRRLTRNTDRSERPFMIVFLKANMSTTSSY